MLGRVSLGERKELPKPETKSPSLIAEFIYHFVNVPGKLNWQDLICSQKLYDSVTCRTCKQLMMKESRKNERMDSSDIYIYRSCG